VRIAKKNQTSISTRNLTEPDRDHNKLKLIGHYCPKRLMYSPEVMKPFTISLVI
jgi:hypothetical protein